MRIFRFDRPEEPVPRYGRIGLVAGRRGRMASAFRVAMYGP